MKVLRYLWVIFNKIWKDFVKFYFNKLNKELITNKKYHNYFKANFHKVVMMQEINKYKINLPNKIEQKANNLKSSEGYNLSNKILQKVWILKPKKILKN